MERLIVFLQIYRLQAVFGITMFFILIAIISGFIYLSQPEQKQPTTPSTVAPTAVLLPSKVTIESEPGMSFTQDEISYPTGAPEEGSDGGHAGGLVITSNPSGATVTLSFNAEGVEPVSYNTPMRTTGLMVGEYTITATKPGYQPATTTAFIREGELTRISITLNPK